MLDELSSVHLPAVVRDRVIQRLLIHAVRARSWLLGGVYTAGALVVMVDNEGHLLLVKPTYRRGWGFPGGGMKRKEQADAAAEREVWEEVGIEVTVGAPSFVYVQRERRHIDHVFVVTVDRLVPRPRRGEIESAAWTPPDQLPPLQPEALEVLQRLVNGLPPGTGTS